MDGRERRGAWRALVVVAGAIAAWAAWPLPAGASPVVVPVPPPRVLGETAPAAAARLPCSSDAGFSAFLQEANAPRYSFGAQPPNNQPGPPSYVAPFDGVVTGWTGQTTDTGSEGRVQLLILRGNSSTRDVVAASTTVDVGAIPGAQAVFDAVRIPVTAGDHIAIAGAGEHAACTFATDTISDTTREGAAPQADPFTSGQALSFAAPIASRRANVSVTIEHDGDRDGWGDSSQDSCPSNFAIHTGGCPVPPADPLDHGVWIMATRSNLELGEEMTFLVSALRAKGSYAPWLPSPQVNVTISLPPGLTRVAADHRCSGIQTLTCPVGATYYVTTRALTTGRHTTVAEIIGNDPDPSNNRAAFDVSVPDAAPAPVAPARCRVPRLRGLTLPTAKTALKRARCGLGRVTRPRKARGRLVVIAQTPGAGAGRAAGARVAIRLARRR